MGKGKNHADIADASALGAALLGHRTLGYIAADATWVQPTGRLVEPNTAMRDAYEQAYAKFKARQRDALSSD